MKLYDPAVEHMDRAPGDRRRAGVPVGRGERPRPGAVRRPPRPGRRPRRASRADRRDPARVAPGRRPRAGATPDAGAGARVRGLPQRARPRREPGPAPARPPRASRRRRRSPTPRTSTAAAGSASTWALPGGARAHLTHLNLPGVADYRERVTAYCRDRDPRAHLPVAVPAPPPDAPGREAVTPAPVTRHGPPRAGDDEYRVSYEEAFRNELRAFHASITRGAPVVGAGAEAARDDVARPRGLPAAPRPAAPPIRSRG